MMIDTYDDNDSNNSNDDWNVLIQPRSQGFSLDDVKSPGSEGWYWLYWQW